MAIRFLKSGLPYPSKVFLVALFDCVFFRASDISPERVSTRRVLADRRAYDFIVELLESSRVAGRTVDMHRRWEVFDILDPLIGPLETNSEGTDMYVLAAEELRKRYDWDDHQLQKQIERISSYRFL